MLETLFGSLLGGVFRIAPEVLKWLDRKGERVHELNMLKAEMEFTKLQGELKLKETDALMTMAEVDAIGQAVKEQGSTARAAGAIVSAISALVRPLITYAFVGVYFLVKLAAYLIALEQGGEWKDVLVSIWTKDDMAMLMLILTFWFVGRVWERNKT